jgi:hypothetical protein
MWLIIKRTEKFYAITLSANALVLASVIPMGMFVWLRPTAGETIGLTIMSFGAGCGMIKKLLLTYCGIYLADSV